MNRRDMLKRLGLSAAGLALAGCVDVERLAETSKPKPHLILRWYERFVDEPAKSSYYNSGVQKYRPTIYNYENGTHIVAGQEWDRSDKICSRCGHDYWNHPASKGTDSFLYPFMMICSELETSWTESVGYKAGQSPWWKVERGFAEYPLTRYQDIAEFNHRLVDHGAFLPSYRPDGYDMKGRPMVEWSVKNLLELKNIKNAT